MAPFPAKRSCSFAGRFLHSPSTRYRARDISFTRNSLSPSPAWSFVRSLPPPRPPMRIALVAEDYYPQMGGVPEHTHHLALQLQAWGHTADIFTSRMNGAHQDPPFVH